MTRTLTILAAASALAVSAAPALAGTSLKPAQPSAPSYTLSNTMISGFSAKSMSDLDTARRLQRNVTDGTSNTLQLGERSASFSIDIGTSEAAHNGTVKQETRTANPTHADSGPNGIIAVLIGL